MKTYMKKILPIILAVSMIACSIVLCTTVVDFGGIFTPIASAADAGALTYSNKYDGTCYITGFSKSEEVDKTGELVIPEEINGLTVAGINGSAFANCTELTKVIIPNTVTVIGSRAFQGCTKLEIIVMSDNITTLGSNAFANTAYYNNEANWKNEMLYLENYLLAVDSNISGEVVIKDGTTLMATGLFKDNGNITKVTIPGSMPVVSTEAFSYCANLTEVVLLEGVKEIDKQAFWSCPKLVKMTIPVSIEKFGQNSLGNTRVKEPYYNGTIDQWISIDFNGQNPVYTAKTLYINGEAITEAVISAPVVKEDAFKNCQTLEKVTFTDSVVEIEAYAFSDNYYLKEVNFGKNIKKVGLNAFGNCSRIEKVNTTMSATEWSQIDFYDSWSNPVIHAESLYINGELLEDLNLSGVTTIKPYAFYNCASIKSITIPGTLGIISKGAFTGTSIEELVLPEGVTTIESSAFAICKSLKTVVLPSSLTKVDSEAFENSTNINYVNFQGTLEQWVSIDFFRDASNPVYYSKNLYINGELLENIVIENVETIDSYAFINCESLKTVYIGDGVININYSAFEGCINLESVDLPNTLNKCIGDEFSGCKNLKKVNYRGTIDEWAMINFYSDTSNPVFYSRCLYLNDVLLENAVIKEADTIKERTFINCDSIKTLVVGGNTKKIDGAFNGCEGLVSIDIQESVTSISVHAFLYCTALVDVHISEEGNPLALGSEAFYGCSALEEIVLPKRISRINNATFAKCTSLKAVYLSAELTRIGYDAFFQCPSLEIVYYESDEEAYAEISVQYGNEALASAQTHYNVATIDSHYTTITVPATCTEDGTVSKSCTCGYSSFTILHAAGHKQVLSNQKDATCTTDGYTGDTICEACKEVFEQGKKIEACGHTGGTATCSKQAQCVRCNEYYGEVIPHSYANNTDSTCNECGYEKELNIPQDSIQDNVEGSVQDNVQNNSQNNAQDNIQKPVQDNTQNQVQNNVQKPTQDNTQNQVQVNVQKPVQDNTQNQVQDSVQNTIQDNAQAPNTSKPYFAIAGLIIISGAVILGVYISKKKRTIAK